MENPGTLLTRQSSMNPHRTKDGMKVLEKFCKRKYRNATFLASRYPSFETVEAASTPEGLSPQPGPCFTFPTDSGSNPDVVHVLERTPDNLLSDQDRETSGFSKQVNFEFPDFRESKLREEIKFDKGTETRKKYIFRLLKVLYRRLGLKYVLLLLVLVAYGLLGGLLFYNLEAGNERTTISIRTHESIRRHQNFSRQLIHLLATKKCRFTTIASKAVNGAPKTASKLKTCTNELENLLKDYDISAGINPDKKNPWSWNDYWNAVFYCATIFTTIGYGNMSCQTKGGRIATICYALIGVPYMLVVLNSLGKLIFRTAQGIWEHSRRLLRKKTKVFRRRCIMSSVATVNKSEESALTKNLKGYDTQDEKELEEKELTEDEIFETFPLYLALIIIFVYIGLCSLIFCLWEEWDYFTAFYFFFISLTTVGLGDEMPDHPHYACIFFVFFLIGLALVSMCVSIMQMRVENQYMAALQIIEEEQLTNLNITSNTPQNVIYPVSPADTTIEGGDQQHSLRTPINSLPTANLLARTAYGIRWREKLPLNDCGHITPSSGEFGSSERLPTVSSNSGHHILRTSSPSIPPPVLGVFIARTRSINKRAKSLNKKAEDEPMPPNSECPATNEQAEPLVATPLATSTSPTALNFPAQLSVITESNDEELNDTSQKDKPKKRPSQLMNEMDTASRHS